MEITHPMGLRHLVLIPNTFNRKFQVKRTQILKSLLRIRRLLKMIGLFCKKAL